ncbi:MAG: thioredoxin domain-containing protein [Pseudomonadota bacterium]
MHILIIGIALALILMLALRSLGRRSEVAKIDQAPLSPYERDISASEFRSMVLEHSHTTPVLVDFYAHWCGPCHAFSPVLSEMAKDCQGSFLLAKLDFDKSQSLAAEYAVDALPAIALFKDGKKIDGFSGSRLPHSLRYFLATNGIAVPNDR